MDSPERFKIKGKAETIGRLSSLNKTEATCNALEKLALQVGPEGRLPTVQVLCESLRISRVTLDRAMGHLERRGVIVRKHGQGIFAAPVRAKTIGILFGFDPFRFSSSPFYRLLFDTLRQRLAEQKYEIKTYMDLSYAKDPMAIRQQLRSDIEAGQIQGLLLPASGRDLWEWVRAQAIPFVVGGNLWMDGWRVGFDWRLVIDLSVAQLARQGCRRIGLISHPLSLQVMQRAGNAEQQFFEDSLRRHGLPVESDLIYPLSLKADEFPDQLEPTYEEDGFMLGKKIAAHPGQLPDGLVISDDMVARGVLTALTRGGIRIGEHIHVATHMSRRLSTLVCFEQDMICVELDLEEMATQMVRVLEMLIDGQGPDQELLLVPPAGVRLYGQSASRTEKD